MKIRLQANSIRFRLEAHEVAAFLSQGNITESVEFGASKELSFRLEKTTDPRFSLQYEGSRLIIFVPAHILHEWSNKAEVGFREEIDTGNGKKIKVLVEKDFECAHQDLENKT